MSLMCCLGLQVPQIPIQSMDICILDKHVIHGGPTSQLTGPKESAANNLVPDTTEYLQRCNGVHASTGQSCAGSKMVPTHYYTGGHNVMPAQCDINENM